MAQELKLVVHRSRDTLVADALKTIFDSYVKGNSKSGTQCEGGMVLVNGHGRLGIDEFFGKGP